MLKQLDYLLSSSIGDCWLELPPRQLQHDRNLHLKIWLLSIITSSTWIDLLLYLASIH